MSSSSSTPWWTISKLSVSSANPRLMPPAREALVKKLQEAQQLALLDRLGIPKWVWEQAGRPVLSYAGTGFGTADEKLTQWFGDPKSVAGGYSPNVNEVILNAQYLQGPKHRRGVGLHEVGHAFQHFNNVDLREYGDLRGFPAVVDEYSGMAPTLQEDYAEFFAKKAVPKRPGLISPAPPPYSFQNQAFGPDPGEGRMARNLGMLPLPPNYKPMLKAAAKKSKKAKPPKMGKPVISK